MNKIKLNQFYSHLSEYLIKRTRCRLLFLKKNMCNNIKNNTKILIFAVNILVSILPFRFYNLKAQKLFYRNWKNIPSIFLWNCEYWTKKSTYAMLIKLRSSHQRCSMKKDVLRNFTKFTGKHLCQSLFFNKVAGLLQTLAQVFSCKFCEISKNTFFTEYIWMTASKNFRFIWRCHSCQILDGKA